MKSFYNTAFEMKSLMALFFLIIICTYGIVSVITGNNSMPLELLWEFILLSVIVCIIQFVLYDERFLNRISIKIKVSIHYILLLSILILFIKYFNWVQLWGIPVSTFIILYTFYFILLTINFYCYKRITGERFNDKLIKYKEKL